MAGEAGEVHARSRALSVLRIRGAALAVALLPAAAAVILLVAGATGRVVGSTSDALRWTVVGGALLVLLLAGGVAAVIVRARPAVSPTVPVPESAAPDLYRLVRDLAVRLQVPPPSAIELTPDCDSWLEDRAHRRRQQAPVLVVGSPFMWWMRVAELRALLGPVVAGTGPSADPDIAAARRFVRGLDAAVAIAAAACRRTPDSTCHGSGRPWASRWRTAARLARRPAYAFLGWVARLLLRSCRDHAAEMERAVAAAGSRRAQSVDYGLRIVAQEQVGLAYAGWDRLLTRVALPAWRMGRWPSRLDAGVVAALTELSRRDRLAEGFESRLGERPACDLLEEPGTMDEAASLLAARLFHGGPVRPGPHWSPVDWETYPQEVVDRIWRNDAARLVRVLDEEPNRPARGQHRLQPGLEPDIPPHPPPTSAASASAEPDGDRAGAGTDQAADTAAGLPDTADRRADSRARVGLLIGGRGGPPVLRSAGAPPTTVGESPTGRGGATLARVLDRLAADGGEEIAARITGHVAREEAAARAAADRVPAPGGTTPTPVYQLLPPRTGRELLSDHVTAMVCCAAVDTAGATPGLDWLDGPALLVGGVRRSDLSWRVLSLVENGDPAPLRSWLTAVGVRPDKPVRLI
jgi:hypothetical protein